MENQAISTAAPEKLSIYDKVLGRINGFRGKGELALPCNYSPENALKNAQLVISEVVDKDQKPALETCTQASVAQALLDTVLQGLNPGKKQCYYIVYGNKLVMQRSRYGEEHLAKSVCPDIEGIYPEIVYSGDVFEYEKRRGCTVITTHKQKLENVKPNGIIAAYCTIVYKDGREDTTVMTIDEIYAAWSKSKQKPFDDKGRLKAGSTHGQYPAEMAKRTVVRRACKPIINSSDDSNLVLNSIRRTDDATSDAETDVLIEENSGIKDVDFNDGTVDEETGEYLEPEVKTAAAPY